MGTTHCVQADVLGTLEQIGIWVMGTTHCVQADVLGTLEQIGICQAYVPIQRYVCMISSFLRKLKNCHTETRLPDLNLFSCVLVHTLCHEKIKE
jgi:hypothetical protein